MNYIHTKKGTVIVVLLATAIILTGVPTVSEGSEAQGSDKTYGDAKAFSWDQVEEVSKYLFKMTIEEMLEELFESEYGYDLTLGKPHVEAEMVTKRDVGTSDDIYTITDHVSAYFEFGALVAVQGKLPKAGTYERLEGETSDEFLQRIVRDYAGEEREVNINYMFQIYTDIDMVTRIDTSSGELLGNDIVVKLFMVEYEDSNIDVASEEDDEGLSKVTISYDHDESTSDIYIRTDMNFTYEDMVLLNDEPTWSVHPKITAHINNFFVSSDLANGVWNLISQMASFEEKMKSRLPGLILNIISSGSRVLDLVSTVKSLTGAGVKDIDFLADAEASNYTDEEGREYVKLDTTVGGESVTLKIAKAEYSVPIDEILRILQVDDETRPIIDTVATILGWDTFETKEMTPELREKYDEVYEHTNTAIKYDEDYVLEIPQPYVFIQIAGIVACIGAVIIIGRRPE